MKRWTEVSPYSGIEEDAPANQSGSGNIAGLGVDHPDRPGSGEPGMRKKKKKDLYDARTKAYREHRAKLEAARAKRAAKKESKFVKKITSELAYGAGYDTARTEVCNWIRPLSQNLFWCHATCIQICKEQGIHCRP